MEFVRSGREFHPKPGNLVGNNSSLDSSLGLLDNKKRLRNTFVGFLNRVPTWMVFDTGTKIPVVPRAFLDQFRTTFNKVPSRPASVDLQGPDEDGSSLVVDRIVTLELKLYSRELKEMVSAEVDFYVTNARMVLLPEDVLVRLSGGKLRPMSAFYGDGLTTVGASIWPSSFAADFSFNQVAPRHHAESSVQFVDDTDPNYGFLVSELQAQHQELVRLRNMIAGRPNSPLVGHLDPKNW